MAKKKTTKKKSKKLTDFETEIEAKKKEDKSFNYPDNVLVRGVKYIREDKTIEYANSIPEEVTERFLVKKPKKTLWNPFSWFEKEEEFEPKGNLLLLMDNDGNLRIYDKVQSGYFKFNDNLERAKEDDKDPKLIILKPNKLRTITFENEKKKHGEEYWKCWVADVNNVNALPEDPSYDCEDVADLVNKAVAGNRAFNKKESGFNFGKWLPWIFGGLVVVYLIYTAVTKNLFGLGDLVGYGKEVAPAVADAVKTNVSNGAVPGGSLN